MNITIYVASAFSKNNNGGNKAGVAFLNKAITTKQKMTIAKELAFSETAFISESAIADYKFEYFTPSEEVDLCGHATIASFVILKHLDKLFKNNYTIETNSGVLSISIKDDLIFMEQNKPIFSEVLEPKDFTDCFDIQTINKNHPLPVVSTGLRDILIPIKSEKLLHELQPNFETIKQISSHYNVVGLHLYAFDNQRIICRNFAPLFDINEESATGTSNAALACYLYNEYHLEKELYIFEQGHSLNQQSEILAKLSINSKKEIEKVFVGGKGYYCETRILSV